MTDLDPCLAGCDAALAEAELLLAMLGAVAPVDAGLEPVRRRIETLRREVDRLRGMKVASPRRKTDPLWTDIHGVGSPWPVSGAEAAEPA